MRILVLELYINIFPSSKIQCFPSIERIMLWRVSLRLSTMDNSIDLDLNRSLAIPFVAYNLYCVAEQKSDNRGTRLANEYSISVLFRRNYFAIYLFNQSYPRVYKSFLSWKKKRTIPVEKFILKEIMDNGYSPFIIYLISIFSERLSTLLPIPAFLPCQEIRFTELPFDYLFF